MHGDWWRQNVYRSSLPKHMNSSLLRPILMYFFAGNLKDSLLSLNKLRQINSHIKLNLHTRRWIETIISTYFSNVFLSELRKICSQPRWFTFWYPALRSSSWDLRHTAPGAWSFYLVKFECVTVHLPWTTQIRELETKYINNFRVGRSQ